MPSLRLGLAAYCLAIRNLRRLQRDLSVVALFQAAHNGLYVRLTRACDKKLVSLRVAEETNEQILLHQLVDGGRELVLVGARLGLDGVSHGWLGRRSHRNLEVRALYPERVAGERVAQLGHSAKVARVEFGHFDGLAALHDAEMCQPLR